MTRRFFHTPRRAVLMLSNRYAAAAAFLLFGIGASGQSQFEVASLKVSRKNTAEPAVRITPGRFQVANLTLRRLIVVAYKVKDFQLSGGPGWISSERYDIDAKTDGANGADAMLLMLQTLLEDRFRLRVHHETRVGAVYELTIAKNGSKLDQANCVPFDPNNLPKQTALSPSERRSQCGGISRRVGELDGDGMTIEDASGPAFQSLAGQFSLILDRPVINRTGLSGLFEVHLRWNSDSEVNRGTSPDSPAGPSIFTAVQEQLGLKLEAGKGPVDSLVIDSVERASEN